MLENYETYQEGHAAHAAHATRSPISKSRARLGGRISFAQRKRVAIRADGH